jgi:hypothetical protein
VSVAIWCYKKERKIYIFEKKKLGKNMKITKNLQKNKNSIYFFLINKNFKKNNKKKD